MKKSRGTFVNLSLLLASIIASIGLAEFMVRLYRPDFRISHTPTKNSRIPNSNTRIYFPGSSQRITSNAGEFNVSYSINNIGFRDANIQTHDISYDWAVIGDSYAEGWGVEVNSRFSDLLKNPNKSIINASIFNSNPKDYLAFSNYLDDLNLHASGVILAICMENDINDYSMQPETKAKSNGLSFSTRDRILLKLLPMKERLNSNSSLYRFIATSVRENNHLNKIASNLALATKETDGAQVNGSKKSIESTIDLIKIIIDKYDKHIIVLIPSRHYWSSINSKSLKSKQIHQDFIKALASDEIDFIDPVQEMQNMSTMPRSQYYFKYDGHLNEDGHSLLARIIKSHPTFTEKKTQY